MEAVLTHSLSRNYCPIEALKVSPGEESLNTFTSKR